MGRSQQSPLPCKMYKAAKDELNYCSVTTPQDGFICTRPIGHSGPHAAHGIADRPIWSWPQEKAPKPSRINPPLRKKKGTPSK